MTDMEMMVIGWLVLNTVMICVLTMILDSSIRRLQSKMRNKYVDRSRLM